MSVMTKQKINEKEIKELNNKFHNKKLLSKSFYKQLSDFGFNYKECLLLYIIPDSANTYFGQIISGDGLVWEFDIDLDYYKNSKWDDITKEFCDKQKNLYKTMQSQISSKSKGSGSMPVS